MANIDSFTIYLHSLTGAWILFFAVVEASRNVKAHAQKKNRLSAKRTSPFKSAGASVQSATGSRGVHISGSIVGLKRDGTRAETRFRLSPKGTSPFKSAGASVQSTAGSRGVRISFSNAGYTTFGVGVRVLATHSIRQFYLHFPSRASRCAIRFHTHSNAG